MLTIEALTDMAKKVIVVRGRRSSQAESAGPQIDFAEYVKNGRFEGLVEDLQSGRNPVQRIVLTDTEGNGLRVIIRRTGVITYHCHYFAPDAPEGVELDDNETGGGRPLIKIGTYPGTPIKVVRERAKIVTDLAANGIDVRWGGHARLMRELDSRGVKWKPW